MPKSILNFDKFLFRFALLRESICPSWAIFFKSDLTILSNRLSNSDLDNSINSASSFNPVEVDRRRFLHRRELTVWLQIIIKNILQQNSINSWKMGDGELGQSVNDWEGINSCILSQPYLGYIFLRHIFQEFIEICCKIFFIIISHRI